MSGNDINYKISEQIAMYKEAYRDGKRHEMERCVRRISRLLSEKRRSKNV